jgi:hypothetical protein
MMLPVIIGKAQFLDRRASELEREMAMPMGERREKHVFLIGYGYTRNYDHKHPPAPGFATGF